MASEPKRAWCLRCGEYKPISEFASAFEAGGDSSDCRLHWETKLGNKAAKPSQENPEVA